MSGERIGSVYASVLATGTSKADHQMRMSPPDIVFHGDINDIIHAIKEFRHPRLLLNKILNGFVAAR
jgi:hypothetical protein